MSSDPVNNSSLLLGWILNHVYKHLNNKYKILNPICIFSLIYSDLPQTMHTFYDDFLPEIIRNEEIVLLATNHSKVIEENIYINFNRFNPSNCKIIFSDTLHLDTDIGNYKYHTRDIFQSYYILFDTSNTKRQDYIRGRKSLKHLPQVILINQSYKKSSGTELAGEIDTKHHSILQFTFECTFCNKIDWHMKKLIVYVTTLEIYAFAYFKRNKLWPSYAANLYYETGVKINATLQVNPVQSTNKSKQASIDNDYFGPLISGKAHICSPRDPSTGTRKIFYSDLLYFDNLVFVTSLPKLKSSTSLLTLAEPFSSMVWLGILVAILATTFSAFIHLSYKLQRLVKLTEIVVISWIFIGAMVKMAVDQPLRIHTYRVLTNSKKTKLVLAIWFLNIIILSCGYKSKLISELVRPNTVRPPKDFVELVDSGYQINALVIVDQEPLPTWNTTFARKLKRKWKKFSYNDGGCYENVLRTRSACLGYSTFFETIGTVFLTSPNGEKLFSRSENNGLMSIQGAVGFSKTVPQLLEVFNDISSRQMESGLRMYYKRVAKLTYTLKGKALAQKSILHSTIANQPHTYNSDQGLTTWLIQLLTACYTVTTCALLTEILYKGKRSCLKLIKKCIQKNVPEKSHVQVINYVYVKTNN